MGSSYSIRQVASIILPGAFNQAIGIADSVPALRDSATVNSGQISRRELQIFVLHLES